MRIIYLIITSILALSACNKKVQESVGMVTPGPNEYRVQRNKTLEMPPHYELPSVSTKTDKNGAYTPEGLNEGESALMKEMN